MVHGASLWFVISSLWYYPHHLSYFNELTGGPENGHAVLVDSNIDWGQDLLYLKWWLDDHPTARPLKLAYFGQVDPQILGIEYSLPPEGPGDHLYVDDVATGLVPGWYAVSVSTLRGLDFRLPSGDGQRRHVGEDAMTYFQQFAPVARAGYSIYIYHLTLSDVNRVREQMGLLRLPATSDRNADDGREDVETGTSPTIFRARIR